MPNRLKEVDYQNHLVGKWHLGHHSSDFLPHNRGFDTALGFMTGEITFLTLSHLFIFINVNLLIIHLFMFIVLFVGF